MAGVLPIHPDSPPSPQLPPDLPFPPAPSDGEQVLVILLIVSLVLFVSVCVNIDRSASAPPAPVQQPPGRPPARQITAPVRPPPGRREPVRQMDELLHELHRACAAAGANPPPTARRLPVFKYRRRSVKRSATGVDGSAGEETCPVCLAAFQVGEAVRLLPECLHLYHAECIDLWLDAHSTCPLCRSDADPAPTSSPGYRLCKLKVRCSCLAHHADLLKMKA